MNMKKIEILFPLFLYALTIIALITIAKNPTTGYEISIYDSSFNELAIIVASSLGAIIYVYFIDKERKIFITLVLILVIMNNFILLSLPGLRGYIIQGDIDSLTHLGFMKDIIQKGNSNYIIYPISYFLIISIYLLSNIMPIQTSAYIGPIFSILYSIYIYLLSKKISNSHNQSIFILLSSLTFLFLGFEAELKPQFLSLIIIPIFLYFLFSKQLFGTKIILILLVILVQFFHPLTSVYFVVSISLIILYMLITKEKYVAATSYNNYKNLLLIGIISFILWIYNFQIWNFQINRLYKMINGDFSSPINNVESSFVKLKLTIFDIVEIFIRMYGHILIFGIISIIFILYYFKFREKDSKKDLINILIILFISGLTIQMLIVGGGIDLNIFRGLNYVVVLTPLFVGSFLYQLKEKFTKGLIISIIILLIISLSWLIGVFGIFPSPYIKMPNVQVTKADIHGADWFFKYKNSNVSYIGGYIYVRFSHLILGINATSIRKNDPTHWEYMLPDHFNYDKINIMGENFTEDMFMPISIYDKLLYTTGPWKPVGRFTNKDFDNISYDVSIDNLYDNGAMNIYYIRSFKNK